MFSLLLKLPSKVSRNLGAIHLFVLLWGKVVTNHQLGAGDVAESSSVDVSDFVCVEESELVVLLCNVVSDVVVAVSPTVTVVFPASFAHT